VPILDQRTVAVIRTLAIFAVIGAVLYAARHTLVLLIFAVFFAYLIEPIVARVQRWKAVSRGSRGIAVAEVYIVLALIFTGIVLEVAPGIAAQGRNLLTSAPTLLEPSSWQKLIRKVSSTQGWSYHTQLTIERLVSQHRASIVSALQQGAGKVEGIVTNIFFVVLIPILAIFLLLSGREFADTGLRMLRLRPRSKAFLGAALREMNDMAAHYIRAQVILAALSMLVYTAVLVACGVQYGLILGVFAGVLEFIPLVGPIVGAIAILGTSFVTGFHYVWALALFLVAWRIMQDYVNSPKLMQHSVKLHPFAVIIAVLAGAEIAGIIGVFLSIPVAAALQIVWRRWRTSPIGMTASTDTESVERRIA
jgi:predicted PurR-regulated permease PerM